MATASVSSDATIEDSASSFAAIRDNLCEFLIRATLIESYHSFLLHAKPYPFNTRESLLSGASMASFEHPFQRSALVLIVDGALPANLRKHIRFRRANELNTDNLSRLAPEISATLPPLDGLKIQDKNFLTLLDRLVDLDYALLMQRSGLSSPIALSHMHVKVERLTDNAVRVLARDLGYIHRTLYENGEMYAQVLEQKFFEYFGFAANASGRKCAAAMSAQLLGADVFNFAVFAACQEDCRLTMLDDTESVTHHQLLRIETKKLRAVGALDLKNYVVDSGAGTNNEPVVCYRVRLRRTAAAQPIQSESTMRSDIDLQQPWLEITEQAVLPLPGHHAPALFYDWVGDGVGNGDTPR